MDNEELDYVSSSALLGVEKATPKTQDEEDLSSLLRVQKMLAEHIASYETIDRLDFNDKTFSIEQQLAINKSVVAHLTSFKILIDTTLDNIKEKYNG